MYLEIISPETKLFTGEVSSATFPGLEGSFGILENHAPMIAALKEGNISMKMLPDGKENSFSIKGGIVEILKNKVLVLAD